MQVQVLLREDATAVAPLDPVIHTDSYPHVNADGS